MANKKRIYMGVISTGWVADTQNYQLRKIQKLYGDEVELVFPDLCAHRIFHDSARNAVVEDFLASDCDALWFLDSDISPPPTLWNS